MRRGARAPLFVLYNNVEKVFGFSLGAKQLHDNNTLNNPLFNQTN